MYDDEDSVGVAVVDDGVSDSNDNEIGYESSGSSGSSSFSNAFNLARDSRDFINDYNDLKKEYADRFNSIDKKDGLSDNHIDKVNPYGNNNISNTANKVGDTAKKAGDAANKVGDAANTASNISDTASKLGGAASAASGGDVNPINSAADVLKKGGKNEDLNLAERGAKEAASLAINTAADGIPISEFIKNNPRLNHAFNNMIRDSMKHPFTNQIPVINSARVAKSLLENPENYKDKNGNITPESVEDKQDKSSLENPTISHSKEEKRNMSVPAVIIACIVCMFICILATIGAIGYKELYKLDFAKGLSLDSKTQDGLTSLINSESSSEMGTNSSSANSVSNSHSVDASGNEVIDNLNKIALGEEGNGPEAYGFSGEWCAAFVSWLFDKVGGTNRYLKSSPGAGSIPRESVPAGLGTWLEDECYDSSTVPRAGDIILFDPFVGNTTLPWPSNGNDRYFSSHIGYVYKVDDENVYTVEGNSGNIVRVKSYSRKMCGSGSYQGINGYYRPNY